MDTGCPRCAVTARSSKVATQWLDEIGITDRERYFLIQGRKIFVDGFDEENNRVYEFYGTYWHADPRFYGPDDIVNGAHASSKWARDAERISLLETQGYEIIIQWEFDYRQTRNG